MSVFKRPNSKTYSYDFWVQGVRFSGPLPATKKRDAEELERQERAKVKARLAKAAEYRSGEMTMHVASIRYWEEVGQHHRNAKTTWKSIGWLVKAIGGSTPLADIGDNLVAELVARRRAEFKPTNRKRKSDKPPKRIGPATVNRTMTEVLRKIMTRARVVWKVRVGDVTWREHMLTEPKERVREASYDEQKDIMAKIERGYDAAVEFAFASGCRRGEIVPRSPHETDERYRGLVWDRVDFGNKQFTVVGKGGKSRVIPMTSALFALLWAQQGYHETHVFTYVAARVSKRKGAERSRGGRYPILESGLRTAMRRATTNAGVLNFRFHDTRHTMATRTLRTSNIRVVQNMLGHERLTTTEKYTHTSVEDVRAAMEAATPTKSPTKAGKGGAKRLKAVGENE